MRIIATCDLHYDLLPAQETKAFRSFVADMAAQHADVLLLAGDTIGLDSHRLPECLDMLAPVAPHKLVVLGNHEYWSHGRDTQAQIDTLSRLFAANGAHLLDSSPYIIGPIGFAGNSGWYDYSFGDILTGTENDYATKRYSGRVIWNDARYVSLGKSDAAFAKELTDRLDKDLVWLSDQPPVKHLVAVTHHLAFPQMLWPRCQGVYNFIRAFMGSRKLGDMLQQHSMLRYHVCGHTHRYARTQAGALTSINPGSTYQKKRFVLFDV